ncbi:uncharacterized protein BT62DRAFT_1072169, partial [Guyanagaster necrorhizus]
MSVVPLKEYNVAGKLFPCRKATLEQSGADHQGSTTNLYGSAPPPPELALVSIAIQRSHSHPFAVPNTFSPQMISRISRITDQNGQGLVSPHGKLAPCPISSPSVFLRLGAYDALTAGMLPTKNLILFNGKDFLVALHCLSSLSYEASPYLPIGASVCDCPLSNNRLIFFFDSSRWNHSLTFSSGPTIDIDSPGKTLSGSEARWNDCTERLTQSGGGWESERISVDNLLFASFATLTAHQESISSLSGLNPGLTRRLPCVPL